LSTCIWSHGTFETFQYNSMLQLTKEFDNLYANGYQYVYSPTQNNGRITQRTGYGETVTYSYDSLNRLSAASSTAGWGTGYAYDGFGNLTDKNVTAGSAPSLHVTISPTTNQIQCCQGTYDNNGNLLGANNGYQSGYQYDAENRTTAVLNLNTGNDLYGYDPSNLRVYKKEPSGKEWMFFYGAGGELLASYFWVGTTWQGSNSLYFAGRRVDAVDRLGSEVVSGTNGYYPYGEQYKTTTQDAFSFATYYRDQTSGLDYAKNRYYSNIIGRFLSADPSKSASLADPGTWNRYTYAGNDPANLNDPTGLMNNCPNGYTTSNPSDDGTTYCIVDMGGGVGLPQQPDPGGPGSNPGGNQNGGGSTPIAQWNSLSVKCQNALTTAVPKTPVIGMLAALSRAEDDESYFEDAVTGTDISWQMLAAIAIRESGVQDVNENDGAGVGVGIFQITVKNNNQNPKNGPTVNEANNLMWSANYAAQLLNSNLAYLAKQFPNFTASQLLQATAASYNMNPYKPGNFTGNPNTIDKGTAGGNYGSNIMNLMNNCF